jgi:hypothetical protein
MLLTTTSQFGYSLAYFCATSYYLFIVYLLFSPNINWIIYSTILQLVYVVLATGFFRKGHVINHYKSIRLHSCLFLCYKLLPIYCVPIFFTKHQLDDLL